LFNKMDKGTGLTRLVPGQMTFCVYATNSTSEKNRLIAESVGLAMPEDRESYGYLSEYHACGASDERAGRYAEDLAASMLASSLGIDFEDDSTLKAKERVFKLRGKMVQVSNMTQSAIGDQNGFWTIVFAGTVLIL
jgi:arginine decarboxylase